MIILIKKSEIFYVDPDLRFAKFNHVNNGLWKELWRRYKILGYTKTELAEYFELKTKKTISNQNIKRWIFRTEIYSLTKPMVDKGCEAVNSNFFGDLEWFVIKELTKSIKSSVNKKPKTLP